MRYCGFLSLPCAVLRYSCATTCGIAVFVPPLRPPLRTTGRYLNTLILVTLQVECPHRKTFNSALPKRQKKHYIHENNN